MDDTKEIYEGKAVGGPYDGLDLESRFPKGVLFVDKASDTVYIYDWNTEHRNFLGRWDVPRHLVTSERKRAAEEPNYDVRAAIEEEHSKWLL
jgi:hypothetical protein